MGLVHIAALICHLAAEEQYVNHAVQQQSWPMLLSFYCRTISLIPCYHFPATQCPTLVKKKGSNSDVLLSV